MGWALGGANDEHPPSPPPSRCKSDSAAFAATEHLIALGVKHAVWSLPLALRKALSGFRPRQLVFVAGCGWRCWLVWSFGALELLPFFLMLVVPPLVRFSFLSWLAIVL